MIISPGKMKLLKQTSNSAYAILAPLFLYHSNHMEGSTFALDEVETMYTTGRVVGDHDYDDVVETRNSFRVLDYVVDTLDAPLTADMMIEMETILHRGTSHEERGESGHFKYVPNTIRNSSVQVALPSDIPRAIPELLDTWEESDRDLDAIAAFHIRFEHLHPFQDGNGRIGRLIMLKLCIENGVDLIAVTSEYAEAYKARLEIAQTTGAARFFIDILRKCQDSFEDELKKRGAYRLIKATPEPQESLEEDRQRLSATGHTNLNEKGISSERNVEQSRD